MVSFDRRKLQSRACAHSLGRPKPRHHQRTPSKIKDSAILLSWLSFLWIWSGAFGFQCVNQEGPTALWTRCILFANFPENTSYSHPHFSRKDVQTPNETGWKKRSDGRAGLPTSHIDSRKKSFFFRPWGWLHLVTWVRNFDEYTEHVRRYRPSFLTIFLGPRFSPVSIPSLCRCIQKKKKKCLDRHF